jgi:hypothetical protein
MKTGQRLYTVLVGDLVGSRRISARQALSRTITVTIDHLSRVYKGEFHAPLALTKGIDELSGVLKRPNMAYRICRMLNEGVYPNQFRFAIVRGALDIGVASRQAGKMDGEAFHSAAEAIQQAKKENLFYSFKLRLAIPESDLLLTHMADLLHVVRDGWSSHQRHVVEFYEQYDNQGIVAKRLTITQQAVSDALRQAHWRQVHRAEKLIDALLEKNLVHK